MIPNVHGRVRTRYPRPKISCTLKSSLDEMYAKTPNRNVRASPKYRMNFDFATP